MESCWICLYFVVYGTNREPYGLGGVGDFKNSLRTDFAIFCTYILAPLLTAQLLFPYHPCSSISVCCFSTVTLGPSGTYSSNSPASPLSSASLTSPLSPFSLVSGSQSSPTKPGSSEVSGSTQNLHCPGWGSQAQWVREEVTSRLWVRWMAMTRRLLFHQ